VFLDRSGKTHKAVAVWKQTDSSHWQSYILIIEGPTKFLQLSAALHAFKLFLTEPLNVVTDSAYIVVIVKRIEDAMIKEVNNKQFFSFALKLATLLKKIEYMYISLCIYSHILLYQDQ